MEYAEWGHGNDPLDIEASRIIDTLLGRHGSLGHLLWAQQSAKIAAHSEVALVRLRAELLRSEFEALAEEWRRDTQHLSQISKKVAHPAYFRIMGMGEAVVPLLLEALRDRPAHWFAALQATANTNPSPDGASPSKAREAWLDWGRASGLVD